MPTNLQPQPRPQPGARPRLRAVRAAALALGVLPLLAAAAHAGLADGAAAQQRDQQERRACLSGQATEDRATCLKEAAAALADARRHRLDTGESAEQLRANALQRCQRQRAEDRPACERLARGDGTASGSVAGGAVLRELTERSVAAPAPAAAASR